MPGTREAVDRSAKYAEARGYRVTGMIQYDVLMWHMLGLGAMINNALMMGLEAEADFVATIENDVLIQDDTLWRLASASRPAIIPFFDQSPIREPDAPRLRVNWPLPDQGQGLVKIEWAASTFVMWSREALQMVGPRPYTNACILHEDEYNWRAWRLQGVRLWQDTGAVVKLLRPPTDMREVAKMCPARGVAARYYPPEEKEKWLSKPHD